MCARLKVDRTARTLSFTDRSQSRFPLSTAKPSGTAIIIRGGWSSNDIANRKPRPGMKFSVGERRASTSTIPGLKRYIRYSRRGEFCGGSALGAVIGKIDMDDPVRPRSSILSHRASPASIFRV